MKGDKAALLELCRTNEQTIVCDIREFELQGLRNPEPGASD
jgi:hypothetical protein